MGVTVDPKAFVLPDHLAAAMKGKRVFITGAGKDRGLGQAFAFAAGMNGAASVAIHFHRSYADGLDTVDALEQHGVNAFPVQCDVTSPQDVWSIRSYVIERMGGPPDLIICNSGLSESGYVFGRAPREKDGESSARRRARVRQAFVSNLEESEAVIDTKVDGFLAITHLWASEAVYAKERATFVYISSRQAVDPGPGVPGYVVANWAVVALPKILRVNLGKEADKVTSFSVGYPFVRTGMTEEYAENERVFGRWQPRMLEPVEAATALVQLLGRPAETLDDRFFQLNVNDAGDGAVDARWSEVRLEAVETKLGWSEEEPLVLKVAPE
ncbi:MAG: SDR family oxidoreductase [Deltaproteobacteria bacterium]|nr:SDR family oxidoreductase [Deltaproteobacteria bacterium]